MSGAGAKGMYMHCSILCVWIVDMRAYMQITCTPCQGGPSWVGRIALVCDLQQTIGDYATHVLRDQCFTSHKVQ